MSDQKDFEDQWKLLISDAWADEGGLLQQLRDDPKAVLKKRDMLKFFDDGANVNVVMGTKTDRWLMIPPKEWREDGDNAEGGKCYGPLCLFLCGPF